MLKPLHCVIFVKMVQSWEKADSSSPPAASFSVPVCSEAGFDVLTRMNAIPLNLVGIFPLISVTITWKKWRKIYEESQTPCQKIIHRNQYSSTGAWRCKMTKNGKAITMSIPYPKGWVQEVIILNFLVKCWLFQISKSFLLLWSCCRRTCHIQL